MANKISFYSKGEDDDYYEPSDSENEYTQREKTIFTKLKNQQKKTTKENREILPFDDDDDDDGDDYDDDDEIQGAMDNSDIEDKDFEDDLPDSRAWGKDKRTFYSTDFKDQDYSTYNENEEELAEQEEAEAKAIQMRLAKHLNETDFNLDVYATPGDDQDPQTTTNIETILKTDVTNLSKRQKIQLFKKDSPEFEGLINDFINRIETSEKLLQPILDYFHEHSLDSHAFFDFIKLKNNLILNYCTNIVFYVYLKAKRITIKNHPIVKRLVQMRQLIMQLEEKYTKNILPQLIQLIDDIKNEKKIVLGERPKVVKPKTKLKILRDQEAEGADSDEDEKEISDESDADDDVEEDVSEPQLKKMKLMTDVDATDSEEEAQEDVEGEDGEEFEDGDEKRGITYQMAKNKGLTPHRKKENRNPRVKHRNKYKKALVKRKGSHRTVRKELKKYSGEMSGIKATVRKGIKIK